MGESTTISVIIPAYNEEELLPATIKNLKGVLQAQNLPQDEWELIVCDNNSTDNTARIAQELGATVVYEPENQISKARNRGAELANGEWLLFIDADTYPSKELMAEVLGIINSKKLIGCGSTISVVNGSLFNKLRMERLNPIYRLLKIAGGAFVLCQKQAFDDIRGFSEDLYAYEEIDFIHRLKKHGKSVGKRFDVLYKHPVLTSGRKGELKWNSIFRLMLSNLAGLLLFLAFYVLPRSQFRKIGKGVLGYWYSTSNR